MNEFEMIERYFLPLSMGRAEVAGFRDDGAVLDIPEGFELVITSDTLNEGVHFMAGDAPANIARKALRVNLSDLAAMGAAPLSYQLNIAFPKKPSDAWLGKFSRALLKDNEHYGVFCSGGDTTSIKSEYLSISITALGLVPRGMALRRAGAKDGDLIVVTNPIGDAYLGLKALQNGYDKALYANAIKRYQCPEPRIESASIIRRYASAGADVSDGLLGDIMHVARASGLGAEIDIDKLKFSIEVQGALDNSIVKMEEVLTGGDDYELVLAVSQDQSKSFITALQKNDLNPMVVGVFKGSGLGFVGGSDAMRIDFNKLGFQHF